MAQRDLKLNSLGRYGKNSERLILEEHGHCEVPAGCGGVVLRWRNPNTGLFFLIRLLAKGTYRLLIDGTAPVSGRPLIPFGDHVLSLIIHDVDPKQAVLGLAMIHDESEIGFPRVSRPSGQKISILSADDGSWRYITSEPISDEWMSPSFDHSQWPVMVSRELPTFGQNGTEGYQLRKLVDAGAQWLGIEGQSTSVWIRKTFTLSTSA